MWKEELIIEQLVSDVSDMLKVHVVVWGPVEESNCGRGCYLNTSHTFITIIPRLLDTHCHVVVYFVCIWAFLVHFNTSDLLSWQSEFSVYDQTTCACRHTLDTHTSWSLFHLFGSTQIYTVTLLFRGTLNWKHNEKQISLLAWVHVYLLFITHYLLLCIIAQALLFEGFL